MNTLRAQQHALQTAICGEGDGGVSPTLGLDVYRHAYTARLIAALRDNYLVLHRVMGDESFDALALRYLDAHPSRTPSIRWFGHALADFMVTDEDLPHPCFADFARMDWALRGAFDAADAPALRGEDLAGLQPEQSFSLHPSVGLVPLEWAIEAAWRALRQAITEEATDDDPELPEPEAQEHLLLVWREALDVRWRSLDALEAALLQAVQAGEDFASLAEIAATHAGAEAAPAALVQALQTWLADGLLQPS
ncbi:MAG TPA: DNA-binding domain-containing protein [Burkholderiaceae bacterium]|jgi:hypothetical protein